MKLPRLLLATGLLLSSAIGAWADNVLWMEDFSISPGGTKTVQVMLDNTTTFSGFQCNIYMPDGLDIGKDEDGDYDFTLLRGTSSHMLVSNLRETGVIAVGSISTKSKDFSGNSGAFLEFSVTASDTFSGTAQIWIKDIYFFDNMGGQYDLADCSCTVTAVIPVSGIALDPTSLTLTEGDTATLKATVTPDNATDKTVTWTSSDATVASVVDGKVTALAAGTATITATCGSVSATCDVTVNAPVIPDVPVTGIVLDQDYLSLASGDTATLTATVTPDNATDKTVTWESSDPSVATVVDGTVTAIADGFTTITATCGDCSAVCEVSVAAPAQPGSTTTTESEAMFNFNEPSTLSPVPDVSNNNASYSLDGVTFTSGSIELTGNGGSTTARVWDCSSSGHSTEYRLYNGATLTIKSADANALITKVEFTGYQLTAISANSSGDANSYTWTNTDGVSSVDFSIVTKGSYKRVDINTINVTYKVVTTTPGTEYETQFLGNINGAGWVLADLVNDQHTFTVSSTSYFTFTDDAAWSGAWRPESNANQTITLDATITAAQGTAGYFVLTNPGTYTVTVDNYGERTFTIERATGVTDVNADAAADAPAEYYNLNGIRVDAGDLQPGLYIRLQDTRATKVLVR